MAVCALPSFQMHSAVHSSNPSSCCSTAVVAIATKKTTRICVLNSRIQSKPHYYLPFIIAALGAGRSDLELVSASRSNTSSSTERTAEKEEETEIGSKNPSEGEFLVRNASACQGCGKEEKVGGCNGEGRIKGGLGAVPGFGWFPIKAYRPCPAFVEAGGKYRRQGQSLEEVAFGRAGKQDNLDISERLRGDK